MFFFESDLSRMRLAQVS